MDEAVTDRPRGERAARPRRSLLRRLGRSRSRCIVLALDGISEPDLRVAIERGLVPNLAALARSGTLMPIRSSLPAVSSVAWSSFMTACNPGRHGIFGFTHPRPEDNAIHFPSSADLRTPTLWERAAADGFRSVVVNLPATYPARPMKGSLVAGFVAPNLERACHPPGLAARLASMHYVIDVDVSGSRIDESAFLEHVLAVLERRIAAMESLLADDDWSLAVLAFTEADRLQHVAYGRAHHDEGPVRAAFDRWFARIDAFLGRLLGRYADAAVLALSDHGFGPLHRYVNLDGWLEEHGYRRRGDASPAGDRAFSLDPGRVYVNATNVFGSGRVAPGEIRGLVAEIADGLAALTDPATGEPIIGAVVRRRDAYRGPRSRLGPNLVCVPRRGYELKSSRRLPLISDVTDFEGTHTADDAFFLSDRPATRHDGSVEDVGATVLAQLRLHLDDVDGRSLVA